VTEFLAGLIVLGKLAVFALTCGALGAFVWHRVTADMRAADLSDRYRDGWMVGKVVGREEALREISAKRSEAGRKAAATLKFADAPKVYTVDQL
jgi:hypothetical protein